MGAAERLKNFSLSLSPSGNLIVMPASRLTDSDRDYIRANKLQIIDELGNDGNIGNVVSELLPVEKNKIPGKNFLSDVSSKNNAANVDMLPQPQIKEVHINPFTGEAVTVYLDSTTEQDDRVMCSDCANLGWRGFCNQWQVTNPHNSKYSPAQEVKGRCNSFSPSNKDHLL